MKRAARPYIVTGEDENGDAHRFASEDHERAENVYKQFSENLSEVTASWLDADGRQKPSKEVRHAQTPVMRAQVASLRRLALDASAAVNTDSATSQSMGELLAANMSAGFALELALKLFFMTFNEEPPPSTHNLQRLWKKLPPEWQAEIDRAYRSDARSISTALLLALQRAANRPPVPQDYPRPRLATADDLFVSVSEAFVTSRYFYEQVEEEVWAVAEHPIAHMMAMLDVLTAFYDHLMQQPGDSD